MRFAFVTLALACLAAATPTRRTDGLPCNTGTVQCCQSTQSASSLSPQTVQKLGLLGVVVGDLVGLVGLTCNPITVIGTGSNSCNQQTVCCENNNFTNDLIAIGCTPINISA
ncbi:hypothetical protein HYPSUDRAFT_198830 [Hypholoma sublateritium FD-334 SS-4]|uniref:Hydrophobin n=1 Tax=Hypholoma sublateritium (strain FD-334 SS-4) TaxID=945553 RepID=A0A0D2LG07_HYPSF|nr:hypothetical protein HYPSUDRAFT_198830 [Hypholoma sublateritium FD-334 SS-4]